MTVKYVPLDTLHDLDNTEALERFPLDMEQVSREALGTMMRRRWRLEFNCDGAPFLWTGAADSEAEAQSLGRMAIYMDGRYDQDRAQLVACFEVTP